MSDTVAVCIPSIPPRATLRHRAVTSALDQTHLPDQIQIVIDHMGAGAAATRNRAWRRADTEWIAFLDDDDELYPRHLEVLLAHSDDADLVYPWFDLPQAPDPLAVRVNGALVSPLGVEFGPEQQRQIETEGNFIPVTVLVRRDLLVWVDGFPQPGTSEWPDQTCEDWGCWLRLLRAGARFRHVPERTWRWNHHGSNTSGKADRWR